MTRASQPGIGSFDDRYVNDGGNAPTLTADTKANRPAADGSQGIWYATDEQTVYYDDGGSWEEIGRAAAQIGAADLGFDPATQTELDAHTGATNNPHSVTYSQLGNIPLAQLANILDAGDDVEPAHLGNALQDPGASDENGNILDAGWQQPSATRPAIVQVWATAGNTATDDAEVEIDLDFGGDSVADMTHSIYSESGLDNPREDVVLLFLAPGDQYRVVETNTSTAGSSATVAEYVL